MPSEVGRQLAPPSRLCQTPPQETANVRCRELSGSTQIEWIPGASFPPPNQLPRSGWFQSPSTSRQLSALSVEWNSPPPIVPAQSSPGCVPGSSAQISRTLGPFSPSVGGKAGQ